MPRNKKEESDQSDEEVSEEVSAEEESEEEVPKKKAAGKRKAATGKPKKSLSAYMIYTNEKRKEEKAKHPELGFGDLTKHLSGMWNNLSAAEKKVRDR
jgi:hypothetical protein